MAEFDRAQLHQTLKTYTSRAMRELQASCEETAPELVFGGHLREWERTEAGVFQRRERAVPYWELCIAERAEQRYALPEYGAVVEAIRADPVASTQVETLIGTARSAARQEVRQLADRVLWALARRNEDFRFDPEEFDEEFEKLCADLDRTEYELATFIPLLGLKGEGFPIPLGPGLEIARLTDHEIAWGLRAGLIHSFGSSDFANIGQVVGLRIRVPVAKVIGEEQLGNEALIESQRVPLEDALAPIEALRAFKKGIFAVPGYVEFFDEQGSGGATFGPLEGVGASRRRGGDYELTAEEAAAFGRFWPGFLEAKKRRLLAGAIRRFSYAADRDRADDRLVDLVIAGETLFLGDAGNPRERGELRYRYALRAACFLADLGARRDIFVFIRNGYDARSAIVHGGEPASKLLRAVDGSTLTLSEFVEATEDVLRTALRKAIGETEASSGPLIDWDGLILGEPSR